MSEEARNRAAAKSAADYEAHPDAEDKRTAAEIDADMRRVREEMTATVNQLAARLDPKRLGDDAKKAAQDKAFTAKAKVQETVDDAATGDSHAIAIIAGVAVVVIGLVARKIFKRR